MMAGLADMLKAPLPMPRTARPGGYSAAPGVPGGAASAVAGAMTQAAPASGQGVDLARIKRNVAKMASMQAPETEIDAYIQSEGVTVDDVRNYRGGPVKLRGKVSDLQPANLGNEQSANIEMAPLAERGVLENFAGGINRTLLDLTGGLVDRSRNVINWGIAGANALTGQEDLTTNMLRSSFGDSNSIAGAGEAIGIKDPRNIVPVTLAEKLAAGAGTGVVGALVPEMLLGTASRFGAIAPATAETLTPLLGSASSLPGMAKNALAGGTAGVGAELGAEMAPEPWKPLAATAGGLLGGLGGAVAAEVPAMARAGGRIAGDYLAPLSQGGRERMAAQQLYDSASSPGAAMEALRNGSDPLVPGSNPTTFQQTGDMGLGALERGVATKNPDQFMQRRSDQNAARVGAIDRMGGDGSVGSIVQAVRERLAAVEKQATDAVDAATARARTTAADLGPGATPDMAGADLRAALDKARQGAKAEERALWRAVDPEGNLALEARNTATGARDILAEMPATAKPAGPEEAAIFTAARSLGDVAPFSEMTALQSRVKAEMRAERFANGETPAYRRMTMLNDSIQRDLDAVVARRVAEDAAAVNAGQKRAADTIGARLDAIAANGAPKTGSAVFTPSGRRLDVEYRVVDANQVVPSNLDDMRPNPAYPAELQPRNRTRSASDVQIARIAGDLQPERLGASADASTGAPIVGPDGYVESGNARTLGIRRAYRENGAAAQRYRKFLEDQGYSTAGVEAPMLVRVRKTDLSPDERVRFAQEANAGTGLAMSASERAAADASRLDADTLSLYRGGEVGSAENRDFVRSFLGKVADQGEEGAFVTRDGQLSLDGQRRVQGALLRAAYDDNGLVEALIDSGDENVKAFGRALGDIAGDVARLRAGIRDGRIDPAADASPTLVDAARFVQEARKRGVSLLHAMAQQDAFNPVSQDTVRVIQYAYGDGMVGRLSRDRFETIAKAAIAEAEQQTTDARLFGEPANFSQILEGAGERYGRQNGASGSVAFSPQSMGQGGGEGGYAGGGFEPGAARPAGAAGSSSSTILERPALQPNFDQAALGRLNAARGATRTRAETFDNKTLGPLLRRAGGGTTPYDVPVSAVAPRIFSGTPKSLDAVRAYRQAVGDETALRSLEGYAVDRLRRSALRDDLTLDPTKVAAWRRQHSDVLRAFPELDARINEAALSSDALTAAVAARKESLAMEQMGVLGRILKLEDQADVVPIIGSIFGKDSGSQMFRVVARIGKNPSAKEGLRKAIVEYIAGKFISNTEAGTSGIGTIKGDQFQTFVRQNRPALAAAGFSKAEIDSLDAIAADLQRANRSVSAVRLPGQSNTAQDVLAASGKDDGRMTWLKIALTALATGGGASVVAGPVGLSAGVAAGVVAVLRRNGIRRIDDLLTEAMLNPDVARLLMVKARKGAEEPAALGFAQLYRRAVLAGLAAQADLDKRKERANAQ